MLFLRFSIIYNFSFNINRTKPSDKEEKFALVTLAVIEKKERKLSDMKEDLL